MYKPKKIIIVGGNAAGPSAAAKAKRVNPDAEVLMFEAGEFISTGTCELPFVLSGEIPDSGKLVFFDPVSFEREKGVKVYTNHFVESINRREKSVKVKSIRENSVYEFKYDSLVLTTGSKARLPLNINTGIKNLFKLKSVSDVNLLTEYIRIHKPKNCLIIGAGYIGLETAVSLHKLGLSVYITDLESKPFNNAEPELIESVLEALSRHKISFIPDSSQIKYYYNNEFVTRFKYDERLIDIDLIISATGFSPNSDLAVAAGLEVNRNGAIKVNRKLQTNDYSIYAAGDNIEVVNRLTNRPEYIPLATFAHKFGHIAGANAAGGNEFADPVIKNISVKLFDHSYSQVGFTEREAKQLCYNIKSVSTFALNKVKVMPDSSKVFAKIVFEDRTKKIFGASFFGGPEIVGYTDIISTLIHSNVSADKLSEIDFNYTPPLSPFINILSILGRKIKQG